MTIRRPSADVRFPRASARGLGGGQPTPRGRNLLLERQSVLNLQYLCAFRPLFFRTCPSLCSRQTLACRGCSDLRMPKCKSTALSPLRVAACILLPAALDLAASSLPASSFARGRRRGPEAFELFQDAELQVIDAHWEQKQKSRLALTPDRFQQVGLEKRCPSNSHGSQDAKVQLACHALSGRHSAVGESDEIS